ncbi:MAG: amidohydrolase family protein [Verrucomicrobiota bacterium]
MRADCLSPALAEGRYMTIDSHHHFWNYSAEQYGWIGDGMDVLKRDFGPADLKEVIDAAKVDGVISVQARTNPVENDYLLAFANKHDFIRGVVGWVDLTNPVHFQLLEKYSYESKMKGFRHVLQGEPDEEYMLRPDFNDGVSKLHDYGFVYDILIFWNHLKHCPEFVDQHIGQTFVLDHVAKPRIETDRPQEEWVAGMKEIAKRSSVYCKISGMATEVVDGVEWSPQLLKPYFEVALEAFGADRLMFGSDWPVCLLKTEYQLWVDTVRGYVSELSASEQKMIMGDNAVTAYGLDLV